MKKLFTLLIGAYIGLAFISRPEISKPFVAATYYFSTTDGDDTRSSVLAQNPATPWKTLTKFNSFVASMAPGDFALFKRGDVFEGAMVVGRSGSSGLPITIGSYGTGSNAVISGLTTITGWTSVGGGKFEATVPGGLSTCNMVLFDGAFQPIGRWPKTGFRTVQSATATTITSAGIASDSTFIGGQIIWRGAHWVYMRGTISAKTSTVVTFAPEATPVGNEYIAPANYGFFFQNHPAACTALGDWAYNGTTHKLTVFFGGGGPIGHTVQASTVDKLVQLNTRSFISFDSLELSGGNLANVDMLSSNHIVFTDQVKISFGGTNGIDTHNGGSATNTISADFETINNNGINSVRSTAWDINGATFNNIAMVAGMGISGDGQYQATSYLGNSSHVHFSNFTNIGYVSVHFTGTNSEVDHNYFNGGCLTKDDGAAIYTWHPDASGSKVHDNIILNQTGAGAGTADGVGQASGTYEDDDVTNVEYYHNTIAGCSLSGNYFHNCNNINFHGNVLYNNKNYQYRFYNDAGTIASIKLDSNLVFARTASQLILFVNNSGQSTINPSTGNPWLTTANFNRYCRPLNENNSFQVQLSGGTQNGGIALWKTLTGKEGNSQITPMAITDTNKIRFEENHTNSSSVRSLGGNNYMDAYNGTVYSTGSVTIPAYSSKVLLQTTSTNSLPTVTAGLDQTISITSTTVTATASDPDGSISSYAWIKLSGPTSFVITAPSTASTTITGLVPGIYQFQVTVTDNSGGTASDIVQITVNSAANIPPVSNAGSDKAITLPVSTVTLTGSASDADGTFVVQWTQVGSLPSVAAIVSPTQVQTVINNLGTSGTYKFVLKVTDNLGATATDTVNVVVSPPGNSPPLVSAGSNQTIVQPANSASLTGSASDPGGSVSGVQWTVVSVPVGSGTPTFTAGTSVNTTVNGLTTVGPYTLRLTATDNLGATAFSDVVIQVNSAANINPTVNAGNDTTITLPANTVNLKATASDADGNIQSYTWSKFSGPGSFTIVSPTQNQTVVNNLVQGVYIFTVRVTDNSTGFATDQVQVTVNNPANIPPVVSVNNVTITLPVNTATLTAIASDPDGSIGGYAWLQIGGAASTIVSSTASSTVINGLTTGGTRTYQVTVTDNLGATKTAIATILVNPAANILPVANAGIDQSDTLAISVNLSGNGTDADGTIINYTWTRISGPNIPVIASPTQKQTVVNGVVTGIYQFELKVTDNSGGVSRDTVQIAIIDIPVIIAPKANAGPDLHAYICVNCSTASVTANGSGVSGSNPISSYTWTKISGPGSFNIVSPNSASTVINGLVRGTYVFKLTVSDGRSEVSDTMIVLVMKNYIVRRRGKIIVLSY